MPAGVSSGSVPAALLPSCHAPCHPACTRATPPPTNLCPAHIPAADRTTLQRTLHATGEELAASHAAAARLEAAAEGLQDQLWRSEEALRRCELQCQGLRHQNAALEEARGQVGTS